MSFCFSDDLMIYGTFILTVETTQAADKLVAEFAVPDNKGESSDQVLLYFLIKFGYETFPHTFLCASTERFLV